MAVKEAYKMKPILHNLYVVQNMTDSEIAEQFGISRVTVLYWREEHGIDSTTPSEYASSNPAAYTMHNKGYMHWIADTGDETRRCLVHRLLAVSKYGFEALYGDVEGHHKNGVKFDNREDNIEIKSVKDHMKMHAENRERDDSGNFK